MKKLILSTLTLALLATAGVSFAREASEGPRGGDRVHTGTHKNSVDVDVMVIARHGADDPVGSERPGEVHGQKRGGRNTIDTDSFVIAREAAEGPRGADNNNHRQRRGGRNSIEVGSLA